MKKRKDGRYPATRMYNGHRYTGYGKTKGEALEDLERKIQIAKKYGESIKADSTTLEKYADKFIHDMDGIVTDATIRNYKIRIKCAMECLINGKRFGDIKLQNVRVDTIRNLQRALSLRKCGNAKEEKVLSTRYQNAVLTIVSQMLKQAKADGIIYENPCDSVKHARMSRREKDISHETTHRALTESERKALFDYCREIGEWYEPLFRLLVLTGMRSGEAGALSLKDITIDKGKCVISINKTIHRGQEKLYIRNGTKTDSGYRVLTFTNPSTVAQIKDAVEEQKIRKLIISGKTIRINDPLFTSPEGKCINSSNIATKLKKICSKVGIENFTMHGFRSTFATEAVRSGIKMAELMYIMGHSTPEQVAEYYRATQEYTAEVLRGFELSI